MCEDEGTRDGVGTAEAARCGNGEKGTGGLCQWFQWGTVGNKVGEDDERDARESSPQNGRRLRGGKVTGHRETGRKEQGWGKFLLINSNLFFFKFLLINSDSFFFQFQFLLKSFNSNSILFPK